MLKILIIISLLLSTVSLSDVGIAGKHTLGLTDALPLAVECSVESELEFDEFTPLCTTQFATQRSKYCEGRFSYQQPFEFKKYYTTAHTRAPPHIV